MDEVKLPPLEFPRAAWRRSEILDAPTRVQEMFGTRVPNIVCAYHVLPDSQAARAKRHAARVEALRAWAIDAVALTSECGRHSDFVRALAAWTRSRPGAIEPQHEYLPARVRRVLWVVSAMLGERGGESTYRPTRAALIEVLEAEDYFLCRRIVAIDAAVQSADWAEVDRLLEGVAVPQKWHYDHDDPAMSSFLDSDVDESAA